MTEKRRARRKRVTGDVRIHWNDDVGNFFNLPGTWCDLSMQGGGIHLRRPIKPGTTVQLESPWLRQSGVAMVRHCEADDSRFRLSIEFVAGTKGQPADTEAREPVPAHRSSEVCGHCGTPVGSNREACAQCGTRRPGKATCVLCGTNGARGAVNESVANGLEQEHSFHRRWPVHGSCIERLRREVRDSFTVLRCPVCGGELDLRTLQSGPPFQLTRCPRCGIPPEAIEAGWLKRGEKCAICSLPVYALIHAVWPGASESDPRSGDLVFPCATHRLCAQSLKSRARKAGS